MKFYIKININSNKTPMIKLYYDIKNISDTIIITHTHTNTHTHDGGA